MAVSLLSNGVSDLCIGKPALSTLPLAAASVGDALLALKRSGEPHLAVLEADRDTPEKKAVAGKLCVADIICYLFSDGNLGAPAPALARPVSALLSKDTGLIRRVEPQIGVLEALDLILDGAQNLVIPRLSVVGRKKLFGCGGSGTSAELCWLTHEDFVRYFLNSIALFSHTATLSIDVLGLIRPCTLAIRHDEPGLSLLPFLRRALSDQVAVAIVTDDDRLLGEISLSALSACEDTVTVAAGIATLTAGDLMSIIDYYGSPSDSLVCAIRAGLKEKGLKAMLELMEEEISSISNSSLSASASSSSSDEESSVMRRPRRLRSRSWSIGRRSKEPEVCHPGSSLVAVMVQALSNRVSYLWVVDEEDYSLIGIVTFADVLRVFRELQPPPESKQMK